MQQAWGLILQTSYHLDARLIQNESIRLAHRAGPHDRGRYTQDPRCSCSVFRNSEDRKKTGIVIRLTFIGTCALLKLFFRDHC